MDSRRRSVAGYRRGIGWREVRQTDAWGGESPSYLLDVVRLDEPRIASPAEASRAKTDSDRTAECDRDSGSSHRRSPRSSLLPAVASATRAAPPIQPLSPRREGAARARPRSGKPNCPVPLSKLRLLTVPYWGFDGAEHTGQLVVHEDAAAKLRRVLLEAVRDALPDPPHAARRHVRRAVSRRRRRQRELRVPAGRAVAVQRRQRHGHLVEPRLRPRARHQPDREPVRRLRHDAQQEGALVPRSLARPARHGHAGGRSPRSPRSAGAGAARGRARRRTTCTSRTTGTEGSARRP